MAKSFLVTAAMALGLIFPAGAEAKQTWTCNIFPGPKHFVNKDIKPWGKEVGEVTKGEIAVKFLPTSAAPPPKQVDGVAAGTFDCAFVFNAFTAKRAVGPLFGILPFLNAGNGEQGSVAYQRTWSKHFAAKNEFADDGIVVLSMFQFPGVHFFTARDTPINSIADLKNQKVWALKTAGLSFVSAPFDEEVEITGEFKLALWAASSYDDMDLHVFVHNIHPDGAAEEIAKGWLKASLRKLDPEKSAESRPYYTFDEFQKLTPGEPTYMEVEIMPSGNIFQEGSRLKVQVSGKAPGFLSDWHRRPRGQHTLYFGGDHASYLLAPIVPKK